MTASGATGCAADGRREAAAVVLCDCGAAGPAQRDFVADAGAQLERAGKETVRLHDLCGAVARRERRLLEASAARPLLVFACRPRAVRALLRAAAVDTARVEVLDVREDAALARETLAARLPDLAPGPVADVAAPDGWIPWFPVVDEARCARCGQCASFCVFGVYAARTDGGVDVVHPRGCKTNCPACARVCPSAAIIFPKHDEAPFDGSAITDGEAVAARTRRYTQDLLGSDPYAALAERRRKAALLRGVQERKSEESAQ